MTLLNASHMPYRFSSAPVGKDQTGLSSHFFVFNSMTLYCACSVIVLINMTTNCCLQNLQTIYLALGHFQPSIFIVNIQQIPLLSAFNYYYYNCSEPHTYDEYAAICQALQFYLLIHNGCHQQTSVQAIWWGRLRKVDVHQTWLTNVLTTGLK